MEEFSCSFSGHRVLSPEAEKTLPALLDEAIAELYDNGYRTFYCGGALGFDTLAAERVLAFRKEHEDVRLSLILPCKDQHVRWKRADRLRYEAILASADEAVYVAETYHDRCMAMRNERLALFCDTLVCYVTRNGSGSSQTMRRARQNGRRVINLAEKM